MKRILIGSVFLAIVGAALAGPPVDYQLTCDVEGAPQFVGVASLVDGQLHASLIDGATDACDSVDGVVTVAGYLHGEDPNGEGDAFFQLTFDATGAMVDATFGGDPESQPEVEVEVQALPQVAVEGKLGAQENRSDAFRKAEEARARGAERAGGKPTDTPDEGDDEEEEVEGDDEPEGEDDGAVEPPAPAERGRR